MKPDYRDYDTMEAYIAADMTYRDKIRTLQDKIIVLAEKRNYDAYTRVSRNMPESITLGHLRTFLYMDYERELDAVLSVLESPEKQRNY